MKQIKISVRTTILIMFFLMVFAVSAERLPVFQEQPYYSTLIGWFNVSFTENGTLKAGINGSFYNLNTTNSFTATSIEVGIRGINSSGDINSTTGFWVGLNPVLLVTSSFYSSLWNGVNGNTSNYTINPAQLDNNTLIRTGNLSTVVRIGDAYNGVNYSSEYALTGYKVGNFTTNYGTEYASTGAKLANWSAGDLAINTSLFTKIQNGTNVNFININITGNFTITNGSTNWRMYIDNTGALITSRI